MGLHVIVEIDEFPNLGLKKWLILFAVLVMTDTLLPKRAVEALDMCLLVLLVRPGGAMTLAVTQNLIVTFSFELRPTIALPDGRHIT